MHKEEIVGLAIRLFAVFIFVYTLGHVVGLLPYVVSARSNPIGVGFLILSGVIPGLVAVLLWLFPLTIARKIVPNLTRREKPESLDASGVQVVAFSVVGIWMLGTAVPDIFYWVTFAYRVEEQHLSSGLSAEHVGGIVATVVELVLGFWFLLGAQGLVGLIRRVRYAGA